MLAGQNISLFEKVKQTIEPIKTRNKNHNNCKTDFADQQKIAFKTEKLHLLGPCEVYM